jgi:menaquinone-9 beta-reductase
MGDPISNRRCDVLVVGGGPSGAACAYWLARAGHDVVLVERKRYPREKTCGDGLTPRSVRQLEDMGMGEELAGAGHRYSGLRSHGFGRTLELTWPDHPGMPGYGYVITRKDLDALVAERAVKAGATVRAGTEALEPVMDGGLVRGATVQSIGRSGARSAARSGHGDGGPAEIRARYTVIADGANSRFGRSLGTSRNRAFPLGLAIRGYWTSPRHDEPWIDSWLDMRYKAGNVLTVYGWFLPVGDVRINVCVGLRSRF